MSSIIYRSAVQWQSDRKADTLLICCSAHEYQPYFREFLAEHLKLQEEYDAIVVPGGIQVLTMANFIPKFASLMGLSPN